MATKGNAVLLLVNTSTTGGTNMVAVGSQRGLDISKTAAVIDASVKNDDDAQAIAGRKESSLTLDQLFVSSDAGYLALVANYDAGTAIVVQKQVDGVAIEEASAIVNDLSEGYPDNDVSTVSVGLTVTGGWTTL